MYGNRPAGNTTETDAAGAKMRHAVAAVTPDCQCVAVWWPHAGNSSDNKGVNDMREHYQPRPVRRAESALDLIAALAIGLALTMLGLAYFDVLWGPL
jgi:hypothetical protein